MPDTRTDMRHAIATAALLAMAAAAFPARAAQHWIGSRERVIAWREDAPADRIRFGVKDDGIYAVSVSELSAASGIASNEVSRLLDLGLCRLECGGAEVAWSRSPSGIRFFGQALPYSVQAPENAYFATLGQSGAQIASRPAPPDPAAATNECFDSVARVAETTMAGVEQYASATNHSMLLVKKMNGGASYTRAVTLPDAAPGTWTGTVAAGLYSVFDAGTDTHSARLSVGGAIIATASWDGENVATMTGDFPSSAVSGDSLSVTLDNTLTVVGKNYPIFYLEWLEISYRRLYRARSNALSCSGGAAANIRAEGFSASPVHAWDVTDPLAPVALSAAEAFSSSSSTGIVFSCAGPGTRYAVFSAEGCLEPSVRGVRDIDWSDADNAFDHVTIIPPEGWVDGFRAALEPLAAYRARQGLRSIVIDAESIYNRYSHGIALPAAIRGFARDACANWRSPPRYLLLAGQGNTDYHHRYTGFQAANAVTRCLLPPFIAPQRIGDDGTVIATDALFGDVDPLLRGPEIAVGRFIAVTPEQASAMVERTIAYEQGRHRRQVAVMASDYTIRTTPGLAFSNSVLRAASALEAADWRATRVVPSDDDSGCKLRDERRGLLLPALAADAGLFHYFGHSNLTFLGNSNADANWLLYYKNITGEVSGEPRWSFPPVAFWIGCKSGMWHITSSTQTIAARGLQSPDSGFTAMIASSGLSGDNSGEFFSDSFYSLARDRSTLRLGDAWRDAMRAIAASQYPAYHYNCFGILGDPAIVFRPDRPSTGSVMMIR